MSNNPQSECTLRAIQIVTAAKGRTVELYLHESSMTFRSASGISQDVRHYVSDREEGALTPVGGFSWDDTIVFIHQEVERSLEKVASRATAAA